MSETSRVKSKNPFYSFKFDLGEWYFTRFLFVINKNAFFMFDDYIELLSWYSEKTILLNPQAIPLIRANIDKINTKTQWRLLSSNPYAISIIEENLDKVDWSELSKNPNAINIIEKNLDKVDWYYLSINPNAKHIIENNLDKIEKYWTIMSLKSNNIELLEKNLDKIDWEHLSLNRHAKLILEKNLDKIDWSTIHENLGAIDIIEKNVEKLQYFLFLKVCPITINIYKKNIHRVGNSMLCRHPEFIDYINIDKINWDNLSLNPAAIHILEKNLKKINWRNLSKNPGAIDLLNENLDKLYWSELFENPNFASVFLKYHYDVIKKSFYEGIGKNIIEWIYHPKNNQKWGKDCWDL